MKKNYSKPQLVFDSFELSESIAAGCYAISKQSELICPVIDPNMGEPIFTSEGIGCVITTEEGAYNAVCYHVPDGMHQVFSS